MINVLVIGSGGREHALSWKIAQSSFLNKLFIAPGNAGTGEVGTNVDLKEDDFEAIEAFVIENDIKVVVVGPEAPLVNGIADYFEASEELKDVSLIGPSKAGAMLEGSKDFAKAFMQKHNIPTAAYQTFSKSDLSEGYKFLESLKPPYVLKADGLAGGKGVLIIDDLKEAKAQLKEMLQGGKFGRASNKVVIEAFLKGIELSVFVLTDGTSYRILPEAKDYKRIGEGDQGLNTGGMGAVSPVPFANAGFMDKVEHRIVIPTIKGLKADDIAYKGFIFIGLISVNDDPYVIEYNCRMGDPETEVVIPRIKSDLLDLFEAIRTNTLSESDLEIDEHTATTVMAVAGGYPEEYEKGKVISGLKSIDPKETLVFHAGTKEENGQVKTNGGRVMAFTSLGRNMEDALAKSYRSIEKVSFQDMNYRKDIGFDIKAKK